MHCKKVRAYLLFIASLCLSFTPPHSLLGQQGEDQASKIFRDCSKSVLLLIVKSPEGEVLAQASGFIITGGKIVTNNHVIRQGRVYVKSGVADLATTVERADPSNDLAILRTDVDLTASALVVNEDIPSPGITVYTISNPIGLENSISLGVVANIRDFDGRRLIQITSPISPGSSGGPVLNEKGEVIGVAVGGLNEGQNLNFAVPAAYVAKLIRAEGNTEEGVAALLDRISSLQAELFSTKYSDSADSDYMQRKAQLKTLMTDALNRSGIDQSQLMKLSALADYIDNELAVSAATRAVNIRSTVEAYFRLGKALEAGNMFAEGTEKADRLKKTEEAFRSCYRVSNKPTAEIVHELADTLSNRANYADAEVYFKQALDLCTNPPNAVVKAKCLRGLVDVSYSLGKGLEADSWFKSLVDTGKATAWDWRLRGAQLEGDQKFHEAGVSYQRAAVMAGEFGSSNWLNAARMFWMNDSDYDTALDCARRVLNMAAGKSDTEKEMCLAHKIIADILNIRGVYQEALNHAREAVALDSEDAWAYDMQAAALIKLRRFLEATNASSQAIRLSDGKFAEMHFHLGSAYFELENWQLAKQSFERVAEINPKDTAAPYNIALCLVRLRFFQDAANWFEEVLRRNPNHPERQEILKKIQTLRR